MHPCRKLDLLLLVLGSALAATCVSHAQEAADGPESDWWSLRPVVRPAIREVTQTSWPRTSIDAFVLRKLEEQGITPAAEADKRTLIRRATFDLIGLPPTPEEIEAFLADDGPDAYAQLIDRLLASPHYGERWGRHWLDVVRYGESDGFEHDKLRPHAWRYRDYVISSFNEDKPYAQFVKEQLAGDVIEPITRDGIAATGFLVAGPWDEIQNVGASETEMRRAHEEQLDELIAAVSQTFLGMTINCARCHDHKFDPFTQADYYRMKAIFDGVDHGNRPLFTPQEQAAYDAAVAPMREQIEKIEAELKQVRESPDTELPEDAAQQALAVGRFGTALDARRARLAAKPQAAYQRPPLTVECWAKLESKSAFNILVANGDKDSNDHWEIYTYAGSGAFSAYLPGYTPSEIKSGVDITDGAWHHVAMVFDARRVRLFVDGEPVKDIETTRRETGGTAGTLYFGSYPPQRIGCDGLVDEVRISTIAREIDGMPDAALEADEHTVGLWRFDEAEGNAFDDLSLTNNSAVVRHTSAREMRLVAELKQQKRELAAFPVPMTYSGIRREPEPTHVLLRGDISKQGAQVTAANPAPVRVPSADFELAADAAEADRRRAFAEWVAHPDNPLTARVMVNRIWQYHFGRGLVETPSDFGVSGGRPSHPELLDWLAAEFLRSGGSIKRMHRLIMLSAAYRQASQSNSEAAALDTDNRLLWRFAPRRLEAEIVRDAMLAVSGELNRPIGGPSYRPFKITIFNTYFYHLIDSGTPQYNRRTIYRMNINTARDPMLDALDCPVPSILTPRRRNTVTTLQTLALMNDPFVVRQAERFAGRVRNAAGHEALAQVTLAFRTALGRPPTLDERNATVRFVQNHGLDNACWVLLNSSEFLYVR